MSKYLIEDTTLASIADAIRANTGSEALMTPAEMAAAISGMSSMRFAGSKILPIVSSSPILWGIRFNTPGVYCIAYALIVRHTGNYAISEEAATLITITGNNVSIIDGQGESSSPAYMIVRAETNGAMLILNIVDSYASAKPDMALITVFGPGAVTMAPYEEEEISDLTPRE